MSEVEDIKLEKVGQTFPVGTVVGLYPGLVPDSGVPRPAGERVATATVQADESLTFAAVTVTQPTYVAAAKIEGAWRLIQRTQKAGEVPAIIGIGPRGPTGPTGAGEKGDQGKEGPTGPKGEKGEKGDPGAGIGLTEEEVETKHLKGEAVTQGKIAGATINEEKLTVPVKAKLARVASPGGLYGWIGAAAAAGTRALPPSSAELAAGTGTIEAPKGMLFLEGGIEYTAQILQVLSANPAVAFEVGLRRIVGYGPGQVFTFAANQILATFAKLAGGEVVERKAVKFEIVTSGWYQVIVLTTEATAASSKTGIAFSVAP